MQRGTEEKPKRYLPAIFGYIRWQDLEWVPWPSRGGRFTNRQRGEKGPREHDTKAGGPQTSLIQRWAKLRRDEVQGRAKVLAQITEAHERGGRRLGIFTGKKEKESD